MYFFYPNSNCEYLAVEIGWLKEASLNHARLKNSFSVNKLQNNISN